MDTLISATPNCVHNNNSIRFLNSWLLAKHTIILLELERITNHLQTCSIYDASATPPAAEHSFISVSSAPLMGAMTTAVCCTV